MLAVMFAGAPPVAARESTANVEVRVWQKISDGRSIYVSARPEGGDWDTIGTIPLPLDDGHSSSGNYRYGDITVEGVEVRVWQEVSDARRIFISARPEGGDWGALGTIPLPLDDGYTSSGSYRYGDITVAVPLSATERSLSASCTIEQRSASWDVEWFALDSNGYAGRSLGRRQWDPTFSTDWGWGQVFGGRDDMLLLDATMSIVVPHPGWVWFEVGGDDGFELYIDDEAILGDWNRGSSRTWGTHRWMQPGVYELRLRYYEWAGRAQLQFGMDGVVLAWSEAGGCDDAAIARLSAESVDPIVFNETVTPPADPGPIVVLLLGIDSDSSCEDALQGWDFLQQNTPIYQGLPYLPGPEENVFRKRQSIVGAMQGDIPGEWERNVIAFSYSGTYQDCSSGEIFDGEKYPFGNYSVVPSYVSPETCIGVRATASNLRELLSSLHIQRPNRDIILIGHSLGGMVAAYYLANLVVPEVLDKIPSVVTIDSPLLGNFLRNPLSVCDGESRSWQDLTGVSSVVQEIGAIQRSELTARFVHLNSTVIGDSLAGGRTVHLGCGILGHGCGLYDPLALEEIVEVARQ